VSRLTRRDALRLAAALALSGCGAATSSGAFARSGSTLVSTWGDPIGDGQLRVGPGESMVPRTELGPAARSTGSLTTLAHLTDAHVLDASSPARVSFLDRLGPPFQSTFRPQEALTAQVLAGATRAVRSLDPELVLQGGDLIDNDQANELTHALTALRGGTVSPGSGRDGYYGVQSGTDTDPFYYRPDVDAPRHLGLLRRAVAPFRSAGAGAPLYPVLGDHDALVAGEIVPTDLTRSLAVGDRALWDLPHGLSLPPGARPRGLISPDGPPDPGLVDDLLRRALAGPTVRVPPDPGRRELSFADVQGGLRAAAGPALSSRATDRLDYTLDAGPHVRLVVLDIVRRRGGSGGLIDAVQPAWLARQLVAAGDRWVIVVSHQPLESSAGGEAVLAQLDRAPRVIATLNGHTHRNEIRARRTPVGGYWVISTASLIDYPQQARALRLQATAGGGVAIETWMLNHVLPGSLGTIARQLSYLDSGGGRPRGFAGARWDRNAVLYRTPVA
jgi:3',5'-cyclic AMP phosphodiesterase CpdA